MKAFESLGVSNTDLSAHKQVVLYDLDHKVD